MNRKQNYLSVSDIIPIIILCTGTISTTYRLAVFLPMHFHHFKKISSFGTNLSLQRVLKKMTDRRSGGSVPNSVGRPEMRKLYKICLHFSINTVLGMMMISLKSLNECL